MLSLKEQGKKLIRKAVKELSMDQMGLMAFRLESDLAEGIKRIFYHTRRIAKTVVLCNAPEDAQPRSL